MLDFVGLNWWSILVATFDMARLRKAWGDSAEVH